jgi:predicted Rossmann-fold nucleotide-binding protein
MEHATETIKSFKITPENTCLESLSPAEIDALFAESREEIRPLLTRCALAVLASGQETDDVKTMLERYKDFRLEVTKTAGGIELEITNAPAEAFVTYEYQERGRPVKVHKIIEGVRQNIFAVLRDLVFIRSEIGRTRKFDLETPEGITDSVFLILRNAGIFRKTGRHKIIVCWGGHAIRHEEYEYTKQVGYQCGLRFMDVITGCGPGAMKGPLKGATIAHSKQRYEDGRYIGISEPGIIAAEAPNPIVDPLVIMPDIEKRLEAFARLAHGIVIFPGGAGTAEELMYILGILAHPHNRDLPFPLILTGPAASAEFVQRLNGFVRATLGKAAARRYEIIIGDAERVAQQMNKGLLKVKAAREKSGDSYYFNRSLLIPPILQQPFVPTHEAVARLEVSREKEPHLFAATLRQVFSAVVYGNVKPDGIAAIERHGRLQIRGEKQIMAAVDELLGFMVEQGRMRMVGEYEPVYEIVS